MERRGKGRRGEEMREVEIRGEERNDESSGVERRGEERTMKRAGSGKGRLDDY